MNFFSKSLFIKLCNKIFLQPRKDMNETTYEEVEQEIIADPQYGSTVEERRKTLEQAYILTVPFAVLGLMGCIVSIFLHGTLFPFIIGAILPLYAIFIVTKFDGLVKWTLNFVTNAYPQAGLIFVFGMMMFLTVIIDIHFYSQDFAFLLALSLALFIFWIGWNLPRFMKKRLRYHWVLGIVMFIFTYVYALGWVFNINCLFDYSKVTRYQTQVLDKKTYSSSKRRDYLLQVVDWRDINETMWINVRGGLYDSVDGGDSLHIDQHAGLLGVPWYQIKEEVSLE